MPTIKQIKAYLEVPKEAEDDYYQNDSMTNRDLIPIPPHRRTWGSLDYFSYWIVEGVSISGYTTCSSLVAYGLSVRQAIGCAVAAGIIYGCMAVIMGWIGSHHKIGYPVFARACYGTRGYYFAVTIRVITAFIWCGVQCYYGGLAASACISAMSPSFADWNTLPLTPGNITSADLVGLIIYLVIVMPCIYIRPEKLHMLFKVTFVMVFCSIMGMLIYCMRENNGPGTLLYANPQLTDTGDIAWAVIQGIFSIVGTCGTGILGQSDWTRYSKGKNSPVIAQLIGAPLAVTFSGTMGALITSASNDLFGTPQWNPINFLRALQLYENNSSRARAGVFFAASGFLAQQVAINILLNIMSAGMDLSGIFPKYLNIRRSGYIIAILSICSNPWQLQANETVVILFGSGWGCFCSSLTGVLIAKYYLIYRRKVLLSHLYKSSPESIYWFYKGFDWRSIVAWCVGTAFLMPGLAAATNGYDWGFWNRIFQISYLWGIALSSGTLIALHYLFPSMDIPVDHSLDEVYTPFGDLIAASDESSSEGGIETLKNGTEVVTLTKEIS